MGNGIKRIIILALLLALLTVTVYADGWESRSDPSVPDEGPSVADVVKFHTMPETVGELPPGHVAMTLCTIF